MDIDSIVSELEIRTAQISKILDVHASPTVSGAQSALTRQKDGTYTFEAGNYYPRNSVDEPQLEYITWDANLASNFQQIDRLLNYLSVISEMGAAIFNADINATNIPSGTALRMLYVNVLAKVARVRSSFDTGLKKAIMTASQIGYKKLDEVNITWQDGLPDDPKETAEIIQIRTAAQQTMSVDRALKQYDGMDEKAAEEELSAIQDGQMMTNPMNGYIPPKVGEDMDNPVLLDAAGNDADMSYNGAQIASAIDIASQVSAGTLAKETAIIMLMKFLKVDKKTARKIVEEQGKIKATLKEPVSK